MSNAIRIKLSKAPDGYDLSDSKFFGTPTVPLAWEEDFYEDEIFLCQIRLSDIAELDGEELLPHSGYLYVFLHTEDGEYDLHADVRYFDGEPELAIDDFNAAVEGYEKFNSAYLMEFSAADEDYDGTKLFGIPSDWNYEGELPRMLLQYDPLDNDTGFLDFLDGYVYLFFGEDTKKIEDIMLYAEYS